MPVVYLVLQDFFLIPVRFIAKILAIIIRPPMTWVRDRLSFRKNTPPRMVVSGIRLMKIAEANGESSERALP